MKKWSSWRYEIWPKKYLMDTLYIPFGTKPYQKYQPLYQFSYENIVRTIFFPFRRKKMLVKRGLHVLESNFSKTKTTEYRILDRRDKVSHCADFPHYLRASDDVDRISDQSHSSGQNISIFVQGILPCIFFFLP